MRLEINKEIFKRINLFLIFFGFVTNFFPYLGQKELLPIPYFSIIILLIILSIPIFVLEKSFLKKLRENIFLKWCILLLIVDLISFFLLPLIFDASDLQIYYATEIIWDHIYGIILVICTITNLHSISIYYIRWLILLTLFLAMVLNVLDFFNFDPEVFSSNPTRAAGLYINPNISGFFFTFGFIIFFLIKKNISFSIILVVAVGILLTFSRGFNAIFIFIIGYLIYAKRVTILNFWALLIAVIVLLISTLYFINTYQEETDRIFTAFDIFSNKSQSESVKSDVRLKLLEYHFNAYMESPILGNGIGSSYALAAKEPEENSASHNQIVHLLNEYGIIGIFLLVALLFSFIDFQISKEKISSYGLLIPIFLFSCFFSHNIFEHPFIFILISSLKSLDNEQCWKS